MVKTFELEHCILIVKKDSVEVIWKVSRKPPDWPDIVKMMGEIEEFGQTFLDQRKGKK